MRNNKITKVFPTEGIKWREFLPDELTRMGTLVTVGKNQYGRGMGNQYIVSLQEYTDYILAQAVISGNKWGISDEGTALNPLLGSLNFTGPGIEATENGGLNRIDIQVNADMEKSDYDFNDDGVVDSADQVEGVQTAGNFKYYGTDGSGTPGFYDNSGAVAGHIIQDDSYSGGSVTTLDARLNLRFGKEFDLTDNSGDNATEILTTAYATTLNDTIPAIDIGGFAGKTVADVKGDPYLEIIDDLVFPIVPPTYVDPTVSIESEPQSGQTERFEKAGRFVATEITTMFLQNDGGFLDGYTLREFSPDFPAGQIVDSNTAGAIFVHNDNFRYVPSGGSFETTVSYQSEISYLEGNQKNNSHGNPDGDPPGPDIIFTDTIEYTIVFPWYSGVCTSTTPSQAELNAATEVVERATSTISVPCNTSITQQFFIATPRNLAFPEYIYWSLDEGNEGRIGPNAFIQTSVINYNDPENQYTNVPYNVYVFSYPTEVSGTLTISTDVTD